jgi:hypothetical protein
MHLLPSTERLIPSCFSHVQDQATFGYLIPIFGVHLVLSLKTILMMPPRTISQYLHPDEGLLETSDQNQPPLQHPSTKALPTITKVVELTFDNIPEVQLQQTTMSTTAVVTSQGNEGDLHLNTNPHPPPSQVNQGEAEFNQIEVQYWDEAEEEEVEADENELIRVQ